MHRVYMAVTDGITISTVMFTISTVTHLDVMVPVRDGCCGDSSACLIHLLRHIFYVL